MRSRKLIGVWRRDLGGELAVFGVCLAIGGHSGMFVYFEFRFHSENDFLEILNLSLLVFNLNSQLLALILLIILLGYSRKLRGISILLGEQIFLSLIIFKLLDWR
jgi:hypothetical protein